MVRLLGSSWVLGFVFLLDVSAPTACSSNDSRSAISATGGAGAGPNNFPFDGGADSSAVAPNSDSRVLAFTYAAGLGRGINLGNALEAPNEGDWGVTLTETDFDVVHDAGFDHVRIPVRWSAHAGASAPYTIDPIFLDRVDWAVHSALDRGLKVVVNLHAYDELYADPAAEAPRFLGLWKQLAEHYAAFPDELSFEILNEPHGSLGANAANDLAARALATVRVTNPHRIALMAPANWSHIEDLPTLAIPDADPDVIATIHYYDPQAFTHQGASWSAYATETGVDWPGPVGDQAAMSAQFDQAGAWAQQQNRPLYIGEFGAIHFADIEARGRWTKAVVSQCDTHQFPYAYWELRSEFGAWDPAVKAWHSELIDALLPGNSIPASAKITGSCVPLVIPDSPALRIDSLGWTQEDYVQSSTAAPVPDQVRDLEVRVTLRTGVTALLVMSVDSLGKAASIDGYVAEWDTLVDDSSPLAALCSPYTSLQTWAIAVLENGVILNTATGTIPPLTVDSERHLSLHLGDPNNLEGSGAILRVYAVTSDGNLIASAPWTLDF